MTDSLQGRGMSFLLAWAYSAHLNKTWWRVCRWVRDDVEQGQVVLSSAEGLKRVEYSASKQCPVASCGIAEVMVRECAVRLPLTASTGLPLSGVWQARAAGCEVGTYSARIFCHIVLRGDEGGVGGAGGDEAAKRLVQCCLCVLLGLSLAWVSYKCT